MSPAANSTSPAAMSCSLPYLRSTSSWAASRTGLRPAGDCSEAPSLLPADKRGADPVPSALSEPPARCLIGFRPLREVVCRTQTAAGVGTDNRAYSAWWDAASGWSSWFNLGNLQNRPGSTVNVVSRYSDHLDLFTTASDGRTMSIWWDARSGWAADWFQVSGGVAASGSAVTAIARHPSHLDLFTVGTDNRVYSRWWDDRSGWAQWFPLDGITCSPDSVVTVIARYPDHLDLFTTAANGAIMSTWWDTRTGWGKWFQVSSGVASPGSPVTAISRYSNHIDLFVTGTDNHIYSTWWDSASGWAPWFNVSGGSVGPVARPPPSPGSTSTSTFLQSGPRRDTTPITYGVRRPRPERLRAVSCT